MKEINWKVIVACIIGLVILESIALIIGINGKLFALVIAIIGAMGGVALPLEVRRKE